MSDDERSTCIVGHVGFKPVKAPQNTKVAKKFPNKCYDSTSGRMYLNSIQDRLVVKSRNHLVETSVLDLMAKVPTIAMLHRLTVRQ